MHEGVLHRGALPNKTSAEEQNTVGVTYFIPHLSHHHHLLRLLEIILRENPHRVEIDPVGLSEQPVRFGELIGLRSRKGTELGLKPQCKQ